MRSDHRQRRFLASLTALALLCVVAQALTGIPELVLYLTPLFLIATLLLSGHYVAEERIVRGWTGSLAPRSRRSAPQARIARSLPLASLLERSPLCRRGPPCAGSPLAA